LWCWGLNNAYQLGNGTFLPQLEPQQVMTSAPPQTWRDVSAGVNHTCGVKTDLSLWCWGLNEWGQVGNGTTNVVTVPVEIIDSVTPVDRVTAAGRHTCARRLSGNRLACWGNNNEGQLGDGTRTRSLAPTDVGMMAWSEQIAAAGESTCAIEDVTGTLHCWGDNTHGQLGDGTRDDRLVPTAIRSDLVWAAVDVAPLHTCGIAAGGELRCWGSNGSGQIGDDGAWTTELVLVAR
jgi:alpha-tubulin suppressor-like RCC1 family protein